VGHEDSDQRDRDADAMSRTTWEEPSDPADWLAAGFTEREATIWRRWRIALATAEAWRRAGVQDGLRAAQWTTARVTPQTVGDWRAAGLDATDAVRCHELGYDLAAARELKRRGLTPEQAFTQGHRANQPAAVVGRGVAFGRFHQAGVPPQVMHTYFMAHWIDDEAVAWARQHVPAEAARHWQELGLTPAEGGRLSKAGRTPAEVIREWWRAGIPYDEVADWLGAGLTAEEAVEQRARGVTVEQAAALRALRRGEGAE
jgi:hypothetical protein